MTFKIGDTLVYPNYGVGVVETVQESLLGGAPAPWYELRFLGNNSRVWCRWETPTASGSACSHGALM